MHRLRERFSISFRSTRVRIAVAVALAICFLLVVVAVTRGEDSAVPNQSTTATPTISAPRPSAGPLLQQFVTYVGTTHGHTGRFNTHGRDNSGPVEVFRAARAAGLDFWWLTEHAGRLGPKNPAAFRRLAQRAAAEATANGSFIATIGYEYTDGRGDDDDERGHLTVVNTAEFLDAGAPRRTFESLYDYAERQRQSRRTVLGFNHPPKTGHPGARPGLLTSARRDLVVMSEVHNGGPAGDGISFAGYVAELDAGWRVAPTCGRDQHLARVNPDGCVAGVLASKLTETALLEAMAARRMYSSRDPNLDVRYTANGKAMGSEIGAPTSVVFDIAVTDPDSANLADRIRRVEILSEGGSVVAAKNFSAHSVRWQPAVPAQGRKYFFVRVFNDEGGVNTAIAAPVWLN